MSDTKKSIVHYAMTLHHIFHRIQFKKSKQMIDSSKGQGRVLAILKMKPEISQKELSFLLDISKQSLAEVLGKLEKNDYIIRKPSQEDRRVQMITLTEKGHQVNIGQEENQTDYTSVLDCLTPEEQENLEKYLTKILNKIKDEFLDESDIAERRKAIELFLNEYQEDVESFRAKFKADFGKDFERYQKAFKNDFNSDIKAFKEAFLDDFKDHEHVVKFLERFQRLQESESDYDFFIKRQQALSDKEV